MPDRIEPFPYGHDFSPAFIESRNAQNELCDWIIETTHSDALIRGLPDNDEDWVWYPRQFWVDVKRAIIEEMFANQAADSMHAAGAFDQALARIEARRQRHAQYDGLFDDYAIDDGSRAR